MTEKQGRKSSLVNSLQTFKSTLSGRHTIKEDRRSRRKCSPLGLKSENVPQLPCTQTTLGVTSNYISSWEGRQSVLLSLGQRYLNNRNNSGECCSLTTPDHETPVDGWYTSIPGSEVGASTSRRTISRKGRSTRQQNLEKEARPESSSRQVRITTRMPLSNHRIPEYRRLPVPSRIFEADARQEETTMASRRIRWAHRYENLRSIGQKDAKGSETGERSTQWSLTRIPFYLRRSAAAGPVLQVTEPQPRQYWLGRFVTLTNAFHYEDSFNQPDIATGFGMLSSYSRPLGCSDVDLSNYRIKRAFMVLENVCTTEEASASLRAFREDYVKIHGDRWMR